MYLNWKTLKKFVLDMMFLADPLPCHVLAGTYYISESPILISNHLLIPVSMEATEPQEACGVPCALKWNSWISLRVGAVVVHHVILFDPPKPILLGS